MGSTVATALAVREVAKGARDLGFRGRTPHLSRELADETLHLVHLQRVAAGVTGRDPGFTVNLNVVHGALRRAWRASGNWRGHGPVRHSVDMGVATRLGEIAFGHDHWWHPNDEDEARVAAAEAIGLLGTVGAEWLDKWTDPVAAIERLPLTGVLPSVELVAALLVERPGDARRPLMIETLEHWQARLREWRPDRPVVPTVDVGDEEPLLEWLVRRLADGWRRVSSDEELPLNP